MSSIDLQTLSRRTLSWSQIDALHASTFAYRPRYRALFWAQKFSSSMEMNFEFLYPKFAFFHVSFPYGCDVEVILSAMVDAGHIFLQQVLVEQRLARSFFVCFFSSRPTRVFHNFNGAINIWILCVVARLAFQNFRRRMNVCSLSSLSSLSVDSNFKFFQLV